MNYGENSHTENRYVTIFQREENNPNKRKTNRPDKIFQEDSISDFMKKKKIKIDDQTQKMTGSSFSNNVPETPTLVISEHDKLSKMSCFKAIQNAFLWIFTKEMVHPTWLLMKHKHCLKNAVVISFRVDPSIMKSVISDGKLGFLNKWFQPKNSFLCKPTPNPSKTGFWVNIFGSNNEFTKEITTKKPSKLDNLIEPHSKTYDQTLYEKYLSACLSDEELEENLYPNVAQKISMGFKTTVNKNDAEGFDGVTIGRKIYALDCEMVSTQEGLELARISLIDFDFNVVMDRLVKPKNPILDYNTRFSGITAEILKDVYTTLEEVQDEFLAIVSENSILVGHSLENDLRSIKVIHKNVIDTSLLYMNPQRKKQSLKSLAFKYLQAKIQEKEHDSTEDAKITLSMAKLKIEILNNLDGEIFHNKPNLDILEKLILNKHQILPLDNPENVQFLLNSGIHYDECKVKDTENNFEEVSQKTFKWVQNHAGDQKSLKPNIIFTKIREADSENKAAEILKITKYDEFFSSVYEKSPENTVFFLFNETPLKVDKTEIAFIENPFCIFLTK